MELTKAADTVGMRKESIHDMTMEMSEILKKTGARLRDIAIFLDKANQNIDPLDTPEIGSFGEEIRADMLAADRILYYVTVIGETLGVVSQDLPR